jgi:CPA1 family monovalent cation:H+ antiporter
VLIRRLHITRFSDDHAADREEELKAERAVHAAADEVLAQFGARPPEGLDPRVATEIRDTIARQSQDADEMPDPEALTKRAAAFTKLYRDVLAAQREALIAERDAGRIEDEAVRAMLERLDLQEAGVSSRLDSRL